MAQLLRPWIKEATLRGCISKSAFAQIIEYLKHPSPNASTATLYLSDKHHYIETIFTTECIQELESQGVTSLGSLRGGIISVKEGQFYPTPTTFVMVVTKASRVGMDGNGTFTFADPLYANDDPDIKALLCRKDTYKHLGILSSSTILAINDLTSKKSIVVITQNTKNKGPMWEDCYIPEDQQRKLDLIWVEDMRLDLDTKRTPNTGSSNLDQSDNTTDEPTTLIPDFYEYITNADLEFDADFGCDLKCAHYLPHQMLSMGATPVCKPNPPTYQLIALVHSQDPIHFHSQHPSPHGIVSQLSTPPQAFLYPPPLTPLKSSMQSFSTQQHLIQPTHTTKEKKAPERNNNKGSDAGRATKSAETKDSAKTIHDLGRLNDVGVRKTKGVGGREKEGEGTKPFSPLVWLPVSMRVQLKHVKRKNIS